MKKHSFPYEIVIFCAIFLIFVVPSLFTVTVQTSAYRMDFKSFPLVQFLSCFIAVCLYLFFHEKQEGFFKNYGVFYKIIFPATFTFSVLFAVNLFFTFISKIVPQNLGWLFLTDNIEISRPDSFLSGVFCVMNFLFAAVYEEIIYRYYFSDGLYQIISQKSSKKFWIYFCEGLALVLFSVCHLYLGLLSVLNAAVAHFVLRRCYRKCGCIYTGIIAHFFYNLLVFILL